MTVELDGTPVRGRTLRRLAQIANTLFRQGFEVFVERTPLAGLVTPECRKEIKEACLCNEDKNACPCGHALPLPERLVNTVVDLGPTFIKVGQIASTRPDLVPRVYSDALRTLQERVPAFSFTQAREIVQRELQEPLETVFRSFNEEPVASASLSQVHFAELKDGTPVAVKVQRPGIRTVIEEDLFILRWVARQVARFYPGVRNLRPERAVEEFGRWTLRELDFHLEAETYEQFRHNFADSDDVIFPKVYWDQTTPRCLTMERVDGMRIDEVAPKLRPHEQLRMAHRLAEIELQMLVTDAFFHADLHPGNIFFKPDGRIVILDVGMVGRIDPKMQDRFLCYWVAIERRQRDRALHHFLRMAESVEGADLDGFRLRYDAILDQFYGAPLSERSMAQTYMDILLAAADSEVIMPAEMMLQAKAVVTAEALDLVLYPAFRFTEEARPIIARALARRATPRHILDRLWSGVAEFVLLGESTPAGSAVTKDSVEERRFRREVIKALAYVWAEEAAAKLQDRHRDVGRYTSTDYWNDHPELHALIQTALGLLRLFALQMERARSASQHLPSAADSTASWSKGSQHEHAPVSSENAGKARYQEFQATTRPRSGGGGSWTKEAEQIARYWEGEAKDFAGDDYWEDKQLLQAGLKNSISLLRLLAGQFAQYAEARQVHDEKADSEAAAGRRDAAAR